MSEYDLVVRAAPGGPADGERGAASRSATGGSPRSSRRRPTSASARQPSSSWPTTRCCCPGLVDTHVHVNEPGRTEWEGFATATRAAAAGGVTTILDMPLNSIPPTVDVAALEVKRKARRRPGATSTSASGAAPSPATSADLRALHDAGVFGFKCFLLHSGRRRVPAAGPGRARRRRCARSPPSTGC